MKCAYCGHEGEEVRPHSNYQRYAIDGVVPISVPQCEAIWQCWERQFATEDKRTEVKQ